EHVGVVQRPRGFRLLLEAAQPVGIGSERGRKNFDGHVALQPCVPSAIDLAHRSRAEGRGDFIGAEMGSARERHGFSTALRRIVSTTGGWPANNGRVILFETAEVLALDKPPGVSMATSSRGKQSPGEAVARLLTACGEKRDEGLWLVHRLDVGTS